MADRRKIAKDAGDLIDGGADELAQDQTIPSGEAIKHAAKQQGAKPGSDGGSIDDVRPPGSFDTSQLPVKPADPSVAASPNSRESGTTQMTPAPSVPTHEPSDPSRPVGKPVDQTEPATSGQQSDETTAASPSPTTDSKNNDLDLWRPEDDLTAGDQQDEESFDQMDGEDDEEQSGSGGIGHSEMAGGEREGMMSETAGILSADGIVGGEGAMDGAGAVVEAEGGAGLLATFGIPALVVIVLVVACLLLLVLVAGMGGSKPGSSSEAESGEEIGGIADISDITFEKAPCGHGTANGGCYKLPSTPYYQIYGSADQQTGSKCLVQMIAATSKAWHEKYPEDIVHIGPLNAPGHLSHQNGIDVDLYTDRAANYTLSTQQQEKTIEYGKLWFSTKNIVYIFTDKDDVEAGTDVGRKAINAYAEKQNLAGAAQFWAGHDDHFHVRLSVDANGECG